jgi:hypothetical protein
MTDTLTVPTQQRARQIFSTPSSEIGADLRKAEEVPRITDDAGYEALPMGKAFIDPEGNKRTKPWVVKDDATFEQVPEGESFTDPEGKQRVKPKFEGIDFTAQTLYDMALTDRERMNVLKRSYGRDAVKQTASGDLYVETDDGRFLKPGRLLGVPKLASAIASEAAPVAGSIVGGIVGGAGGAAGGAVGGPPGVVAASTTGAVMGAGAGAGIGQGFNDIVLGLAGVYDRSASEEVSNLAGAAATGAVGEGAGRAAIAAIPFAKAIVSKTPAAIARTVGDYVGAYKVPGAMERSGELASKGVKVRPSGWMSEAPYLKSVVEEFDPVFRQQDVLSQSAQKHYEESGGKIARDLGISSTGELTGATAKASSLKAGEAMRATVRADMAREDAALERATTDARIVAQSRFVADKEVHDATVTALKTAHKEATDTAQRVVDEGFASLKTGIDEAVKVAQTGGNPGDLVRGMTTKLRAFRGAIGQRAKILYDSADAAAGTAKPDLGTIQKEGSDFLESLPKPFQDKYPDIVKKITELENGKTSFGQLRNLRSILRHDIDYNDLTPSFREGAFARFEDRVDQIIHDAGARPELREAAKLLDTADAFYAKNIRTFKSEGVRSIMRFMDAGMPPDPKTLAGVLFQKDATEFIEKARKIAGKPLWGAVQAADTQAMFDASKTLAPGQIDGVKFAGEVAQRVKDGILTKAYDKETAAKLLNQAQRVLAREGKLDIAVNPGDTVFTALKRADEAQKAIADLAERDPLGTLKTEMTKIEKEFSGQEANLKAARAADPLRHLQSPTVGAMESADRILRNPDMMIAAAAKFGHDSPEFTMLRQVGAMRILQRALPKTAKTAKYFEESFPEEVQRLLFPGATHGEMVTLAKDMEFLLGGGAVGAGGSIAAKARVLHPLGSVPLVGGILSRTSLPGVDAIGRLILAKYYQTVTYAVTHPAFIQWVAKGLRGPPSARAMVREEWQKAMKIGGGTGAAIGETMYQNPQESQ